MRALRPGAQQIERLQRLRPPRLRPPLPQLLLHQLGQELLAQMQDAPNSLRDARVSATRDVRTTVTAAVMLWKFVSQAPSPRQVRRRPQNHRALQQGAQNTIRFANASATLIAFQTVTAVPTPRHAPRRRLPQVVTVAWTRPCHVPISVAHLTRQPRVTATPSARDLMTAAPTSQRNAVVKVTPARAVQVQRTFVERQAVKSQI